MEQRYSRFKTMYRVEDEAGKTGIVQAKV